MATHSSILAWEIPWSLAGCSPWRCRESDETERLSTKHRFVREQSRIEFPPSVPSRHLADVTDFDEIART